MEIPVKQCILVVSFGTSYKETREKAIGQIETAVSEAFSDYEVRRAFTSRMIIEKLSREGVQIDNVAQALNRLEREGFEKVIVQPTHMMNGEECDNVRRQAEACAGRFKILRFGTPVLTASEDYNILVHMLMAEIKEAGDKSAAIVFMGHGTRHHADSAYAALDYRFKTEGFDNVFVGTVEGYPDISTVIDKVNAYKPEKVILYPLMVVAGDHAHNDMSGNSKESWKSLFEKEGYDVRCVVRGLGELEGFRRIFIEHIKSALPV